MWEIFYWIIILLAFALGTAGGDLLAEGLSMGYGQSALIFAAAIAVTAIGFYKFKMKEIWAFWIAFILTRPLGASLGDLLSQPISIGGIGLGTVGTTGIFTSIILSLVIYLTIKGKNEPFVLELIEQEKEETLPRKQG